MSLPTRPSADDLTSLSKLTINTSHANQRPARKFSPPVADSWEEEADADADNGPDTETESERLSHTKTQDPPGVPPPTPASPNMPMIPAAYGPRGEVLDAYSSVQPSRERGSGARTPDRRPEKTTSVAARLIAGGLGLRAPKKTEEQKEYEKAVREKERKRREEEKVAQQDAEKAKQSVWED